jgi:hypothetical protein
MADKISTAPSETISPENKRFSELIESGKYGKILKDPKTGDVAVVFGDNQSVKLSAKEVRTSRPEYGSEKNPADLSSYVSPTGEPFSPRIESRPMASAEILEAARMKFEKARGGMTLREGVPKLLSEYGVALEENGKNFRLVDSGNGNVMEFAIEGKTAYERQRKAAQLFLVVGKAMETMRTCEARHPLMAECRAYSSTDPIVSYGYRELKIDDRLFGDTVIASGEELAGLTSAERKTFAEKLAPFVNGVFKTRYDAIVRKGVGPLASDNQ